MKKESGSVNACHRKWVETCKAFVKSKHPGFPKFFRLCREIIEDFDAIPITDEIKPKVGIVGEILVKFAPAANNHLVDLLESEGAEAVVPDLLDFMFYCFYNQLYKAETFGNQQKSAFTAKAGIKAMQWVRSGAAKAFLKNPVISMRRPGLTTLLPYAAPIVSIGNQTGEGWFLTGEMVELIARHQQYRMYQPFGCLPNSRGRQGVIKSCASVIPNPILLPLITIPEPVKLIS